MTNKQRKSLALASCVGAVTMPGALILGYPGVMAPYWQETFQMSKSDIGTVVFIMFAAVGVFGFLIGRMHGRYGVRPAMMLGGVICGLNLMVCAFAANSYFLYAWSFFNGVAVGAVWNAAITSVQHWFPERRGVAAGMVNLAFGGSAVVLVPLVAYLLSRLGYFWLHIYLGCFALAVGVVSALFAEIPQRVKELQTRPSSSQGAGFGGTVNSYTVKESLRSRNFWLLWLTYALQGAAGISMLTFATAFGLAQGYSLESSVLILFCFSVTNALSRIVTGYASDRMSRGLVMSLSFWAAGLAYLLLPCFSFLSTAIICASIIGFAFGTLLTVSVPLASDCFGLEHFGAIFGLIFTAFGFVSGAIGPILGGYILDHTNGNFTIIFIYLGLLCLLSGVFVRFVIPERRSYVDIAL